MGLEHEGNMVQNGGDVEQNEGGRSDGGFRIME